MRWPDDYRNWPYRTPQLPHRPAVPQQPRSERPPRLREDRDLGATMPCPACGADMPRLWFVERCGVCGTAREHDR
jgi:hypothetical protein